MRRPSRRGLRLGPSPAARVARDFEKWAHRDDPLCFSGVWRFRELLPFAPPDKILTIGEGQTILQKADAVAKYVGLNPGRLFLQYEGLNPSGSFKDNGMTAAFTHARLTGARRAACASTGNTSASLAVFCSASGLMKAIVFIGSGKISYGKLAQALDHGALTIQIAGDFDDAMQRVQQVSRKLGIYLVNSVNPFRLEGQKTIMYRVLEALRWEAPDWIVVPGGNLGNVSAFGKAFMELADLGLLKHLPRLAVINAAGANTFHMLYEKHGLRWNVGRPDAAVSDGYFRGLSESGVRASTIASAIEINLPVNLTKACAPGPLRRRGARDDRSGYARRQGAGRGGRAWLRAGVGGQRGGRPAAAPGGRHRRRRARGLHPDRPPAQGPDGDGGVSQHRSADVRRGAGQPRRAPRRLRQPGRAGAQRPGRHHQGDRGLLLMTKEEARKTIDSLGLPPAQAAAARRTISRATTKEDITLVAVPSGTLVIARSRPGRNGRQVFEDTIRPDGGKEVVQKAYDAAGNLVHLDPQGGAP